ncbi:MAG: hypothetical protein K0A95_07910 [Chromatiales bacterium]|nr:hypothetical protein [Gammaproteobacteria bacterium]MBW6476981.1 hypothetical protein [Chromatiales bacterium]
MRSLFVIPLALFALGASLPTLADTLRMPASTTAESQLAMPERGMSMDQVRAKYGQPREIKSAVGQPPITRWVYENYTVYFEHRHVINSVAHRP